MENQKQKDIIRPIEDIKQNWQSFANLYSTFDLTMHTFYYTLINVLQLQNAKHVLEIGCGTSKLLPIAVQLKQKKCTYTATDLCQNMVALAKQNLRKYLKKMGVQQQLHQWLESQSIHIQAANGQEHINSSFKFDRIIANLVIMITQDPIKMLKNFYEMADEDCLLGLTIWGEKAMSNFIPVLDQAILANGGTIPKVRSNFHLFNKLEDLASESGWKVVMIWQQNAPFNFIFMQDQRMLRLIRHWCKNDAKLVDFYLKRVQEVFGAKKILNFPVQMAVFKKQSK